MITLYGFGPFLGLPDPSPFVLKTMFLLKLARLDYAVSHSGRGKAPKGKLPFIDDGGTIVADSTFIRLHLEEKYGVDFDAGLDAAQRGAAWAVEKMLEDHLYWSLVDMRWLDDFNFEHGTAVFFDKVPWPFRGFVKSLIRRKIAKRLAIQGMGRHAKPEIELLGTKSVEALAAVLGPKPFLMGERPCGADATAASFVAQTLLPAMQSPIREAMAGQANLVAYRDRMIGAYFPEVRLA